MNVNNKDKKFISIIIHLKENKNQLIYFLAQLEKIFSEHFESYEYIIVNNSLEYDLTLLLTKEEINKINGSINIINLSWTHNIEDAMRAGIEMSIGDFVFEFDTLYIDFNLSLIMEVYNTSINGYDMVAAVSSKTKSSSSKLFYNTLSKFSNHIELTTETFRVVSRRMLNKIAMTKEAFRYRKINYHYSGLQSKVIVYDSIQSIKNNNNFSFSDKLSLASNILVYYSNVGTKISLILSLFFLLVSILVGIYAIVSFIVLKENIQEGWTTIMLFLSISFAGLFGILAVISKYMEVLLKEIKINSSYTYKSIETYKK